MGVAQRRPSDPDVARVLGSREATHWSSKASLIQRLRKEKGLASHEACLVEDDIREVRSVKATETCLTVFVKARRGLEGPHLQELRKMAGLAP
eukprot:NODE_4784_length_641_cov_267.003413.p2 GENE.NODE_4784_length_641_cov_267.003413~~NODE_4784_length_641_cov_267.003413.p2  ORF type:complete len:93 (+),score=24.03 NODE_4784_length_641_cov_267.003413:3-281(+)